MSAEDFPDVHRVSFADALQTATEAARKTDPDRAARMLAAASQLEPLHAIQVSFDGLARTARDRREGVPDPYANTLAYHAKESLDHVAYHRDVLKAAYDAAEAMMAEMAGQFPAAAKTEPKPEPKPIPTTQPPVPAKPKENKP